MSGIEVAGLIIGAVPVLVAALEHYKAVHKKTWLFKNKSSRFDQLIIALGNQKFFLQGELELALLEAGFERCDIASMHTNDLRRLLSRDDVSEGLIGSLGPGYDPFKETIVRCQTSLAQIILEMKGLVPGSQSCGLEEMLKANQVCANGRYEFRNRIKFVMKNDELKQRIDDLKDATDTLTKLRQMSKSLNCPNIHSPQGIITKYAAFLQRIQQYADVLHFAISRRLVSACHQEHETRLYLESRASVLQKQREVVGFRLIFGAPSAPLGGSLMSQEIQVAAVDDDLPEVMMPQRQKKRRVTFELAQPSESQKHLIAEVQNLCLSLDLARQARETLKLYLSPHGVLSSSRIAPVQNKIAQPEFRNQETVTLEQYLRHISQNGPSLVHWNPMQRMTLSFILASSLLQLYSTPWMIEPWSKKRIYFWRMRSSLSAENSAFLVDTNRPFIVRKFSDTPAAYKFQEADARHQLLNLGILLLEVGHQKSFESWTSAHGLAVTQTYGSRYDAASAWLQDSVGELLSSYHDAAARCIECTFQTRSAIPDWEDFDFKRSICELVLKPLWKNCFTIGF